MSGQEYGKCAWGRFRTFFAKIGERFLLSSLGNLMESAVLLDEQQAMAFIFMAS